MASTKHDTRHTKHDTRNETKQNKTKQNVLRAERSHIMPTVHVNTSESPPRRAVRVPPGPHPGGPPGRPVEQPPDRTERASTPADVRFVPNPRTLSWFASASQEVQSQSLESFFMTTDYEQMSDEDLMGTIAWMRDRRRQATEQKRKRTVRKRESAHADAKTGVRGNTLNKIIKAGDSDALDDFVKQAMVKKMRDQGMSENEIEERLTALAAVQAQAQAQT